MMTAQLNEIISDAEVIRVHGNANFGTMRPREVVNDGVRKAALGYHTGHTQFCILRDHGLITKPRGMSYDVNLTKKGKRYARGLSIFAAPAQPDPAADAWRPIASVVPNEQVMIWRPSEFAEDHTFRAVLEDGTWYVHDGKFDHPLRGDYPTHWRPLLDDPEGEG